MTARSTDTPFVALPTRFGNALCLLGPKPAEAMVSVDLLVRVDAALTVVQSFVAGICDRDGRLIIPLEIELVADAATVVPHKQVPADALLEAFNASPAVRSSLPRQPGGEFLRDLMGEPGRFGPLIFCRKTRAVFVARSPTTGAPLARRPDIDRAQPLGNPDLAYGLITWDGPPGDDAASYYGGRGGDTALGAVHSLERLLIDQSKVVREALRLQSEDPEAARDRQAAAWCCQCPDCQTLDDPDAKYKHALDRLAVLNAADIPVNLTPLGAWRLSDAARIICGVSPGEVAAETAGEQNEFEKWRVAQAVEIETSGPARILSGETDGRELLEICRVTLGLIEGTLAQLDAAWRATQRPHLCWNDETIRVLWNRPAQIMGMVWGFRPVLRKTGLQPAAPFPTPNGDPVAYPPAFTTPTLLSTESQNAVRYFDEPRTATVFVKGGKGGDERQTVTVLLEDLGVAWELFRPGDALHVLGKDWTAILSPMTERDPNDGDGLPFAGYVDGSPMKVGEQYDNCEVRWYPRFGEATDLHALGVLAIEALLSNDERNGELFRSALTADCDGLTKSCLTMPVEHREAWIGNWLGERCETDAPAAVWTRRNLLYTRASRAGTRLDAFPPALWQAAMTWELRMITTIPGFSYCDDRTMRAPRIENELLPLLELRGILALIDDHLFKRSQPGAAMRAELTPED